MNTLDISDWKQKDVELKTAIADACRHSNYALLGTLPDELVVTQDQFDMLKDDPDIIAFEGEAKRIWVTPHNAMEITVKQ